MVHNSGSNGMRRKRGTEEFYISNRGIRKICRLMKLGKHKCSCERWKLGECGNKFEVE